MYETITVPCNHPELEEKGAVIHVEFDGRYLHTHDWFFADVDKLIKKLSKDDLDSMRIARSNFEEYDLDDHVASNGRYKPLVLGTFSYSRVGYEMPSIVRSDFENNFRRIFLNIRHRKFGYEFPLRLMMNSPKSEGLLILQALGVTCIPIMVEKYGSNALWLAQLRKLIGTDNSDVFEDSNDFRPDIKVPARR